MYNINTPYRDGNNEYYQDIINSLTESFLYLNF